MEMPSINIFVISAPPVKKEKKERKLTSALRKKEDSMITALNDISQKLNKLPTTSHMGGG